MDETQLDSIVPAAAAAAALLLAGKLQEAAQICSVRASQGPAPALG